MLPPAESAHSFPEEWGKVFAARMPPEKFVAIVDNATGLLYTEPIR
jgi:hypothetical protein